MTLNRALDIEVYDDWGEHTWAQARYLVHGTDDVLWTDSVDEVLALLRSELERLHAVDGSKEPTR